MPTATREEIRIGQLAIRFVVEGDESKGAVAMFEFDVPAGAKVPIAHSHDGYEETIYGLEGVLTWTVEQTPTDVGPGEALFIPRGVVHRFDNTGDVDARALADHANHSGSRVKMSRMTLLSTRALIPRESMPLFRQWSS